MKSDAESDGSRQVFTPEGKCRNDRKSVPKGIEEIWQAKIVFLQYWDMLVEYLKFSFSDN